MTIPRKKCPFCHWEGETIKNYCQNIVGRGLHVGKCGQALIVVPGGAD